MHLGPLSVVLRRGRHNTRPTTDLAWPEQRGVFPGSLSRLIHYVHPANVPLPLVPRIAVGHVRCRVTDPAAVHDWRRRIGVVDERMVPVVSPYDWVIDGDTVAGRTQDQFGTYVLWVGIRSHGALLSITLPRARCARRFSSWFRGCNLLFKSRVPPGGGYLVQLYIFGVTRSENETISTSVLVRPSGHWPGRGLRPRIASRTRELALEIGERPDYLGRLKDPIPASGRGLLQYSAFH